MIDELGEPPTYQHRAGRVGVIYQFYSWLGWPEELAVRSDEPIVQLLATIAERIAEFMENITPYSCPCFASLSS